MCTHRAVTYLIRADVERRGRSHESGFKGLQRWNISPYGSQEEKATGADRMLTMVQQCDC